MGTSVDGCAVVMSDVAVCVPVELVDKPMFVDDVCAVDESGVDNVVPTEEAVDVSVFVAVPVAVCAVDESDVATFVVEIAGTEVFGEGVTPAKTMTK